MAYVDDLMEQRSDPIGFSLKERKQQLLNQKLTEKQANLDPEALVTSDLLKSYNESVNSAAPSSSLLDFAESSGYRALGNLGDAGRSISNSLVMTDFDSSTETGWSNQQKADAAAGLDPNARNKYNEDVQGVYQDIANDDWLSAAKGSLALGPRALADSAATIPELAAGAALTATGLGSGAGLTLLGNKGRKVAKGIKAIGQGIDKAKENSKAFSMVANSLRTASGTSILTADMVQQQVNDYKRENDGESPSSQRVAAMITGNVAANMLQVSILKNLFLPMKGKAGNVKPSLKKFKEEMSNLVGYAEEGTAHSIVKTLAGAIPKVLAAGGAEAAQEYVQTWVEILGVKMDPEEAGGLMASAYKEITNEENRNKAVLGAMLGASAGGTARAALSAPGISAKLAADVTKGGVKAAGRVAQDVGSRAAVGALSEKGIEELKADYEIQKSAAKDATDKLTSKIDTVSKASSVEELSADSDIAEDVKKYQSAGEFTNEQMNSPETLKDLKDTLTRTYKADRTKVAVGFKASNLASMARTAAKVNFKRVSNSVLEDEDSSVEQEAIAKSRKDFDTEKDKNLKVIDSVLPRVRGSASISDMQKIPYIRDSVATFKASPNNDTQEAFSKFKQETIESLKSARSKQESSEFKYTPASRLNKITGKMSKVINNSDSETVIGTVKDLSSAAVKTVKEIKSSTALGIIEMSANATKAQSKAAVEAARNLELEDIVRTAAVVKEKNPQLARALSSVASQMEKAKTRAGQYTKDTLTKENMPGAINKMVEVGKVTDDQANSALANIANASKMRIKDSGALEQLQKALDVYKNSPVQQNVEGVKIIEQRLKTAAGRIKASRNSTKGKVGAFVEGLDIQGIKDSIKNTVTVVANEKGTPVKQAKAEAEAVAESVTEDTPAANTGDAELDNKQLMAIYGISDFIKKSIRKPENAGSQDAILRQYTGYLKDNIGETRHSVLDIMEDTLGGLTDSQRSIISEYYPTTFKPVDETVIVDEEFDSVESKELSDTEAKASYTKHFPGCKI